MASRSDGSSQPYCRFCGTPLFQGKGRPRYFCSRQHAERQARAIKRLADTTYLIYISPEGEAPSDADCH